MKSPEDLKLPPITGAVAADAEAAVADEDEADDVVDDTVDEASLRAEAGPEAALEQLLAELGLGSAELPDFLWDAAAAAPIPPGLAWATPRPQSAGERGAEDVERASAGASPPRRAASRESLRPRSAASARPVDTGRTGDALSERARLSVAAVERWLALMCYRCCREAEVAAQVDAAANMPGILADDGEHTNEPARNAALAVPSESLVAMLASPAAALERVGLGRAQLAKVGLSPDLIDRVYIGLFVYSLGFHQV